MPSHGIQGNVVTISPPNQQHVQQMALELAREQIHDLSQPATALLCHLELGRIMGTDEAMREAVVTGIAEAARLVAIIQTLRDTVARGLACAEKGNR